ncbi:hypothetical protein [Nodosilinea nodulosa]|uniref:hypothetical protein n=1 Tax=Nodosilinea nodulosa TaxID=416001 RepID=UPI0002DC4487|nr:hypothetical protein [Nodosilinea nodulosa]
MGQLHAPGGALGGDRVKGHRLETNDPGITSQKWSRLFTILESRALITPEQGEVFSCAGAKAAGLQH